MSTQKKPAGRRLGIFIKILSPKLILVIILLVLLGGGAIGISKHFASESKITKIGFEDIGELATQSATCKMINVSEASLDLFGTKIPFIQSKYIYSYDVEIKAGFDFNEIEWEEKGTTIEVRLPEAKILSSEVKLNSFNVYHEQESLFRRVSLEENNQAILDLQKNAEAESVANGLLDNARSNAETILTSFFFSKYDPEEYKIKFVTK